MTGQNAAKYSDPKEVKRGRPPKQQESPNSVNGEGVLQNGAANVGIAVAMLQPEHATADDSILTPVTQDARDKKNNKRKLPAIMEHEDSDGSEGAEGEDSEALTTPNPGQPGNLSGKGRRRAQTQRIPKGQSDGAWRDSEGPRRWQLRYPAMYPWAECVPANESAGVCDDTVRCTACSLRKDRDFIVACRSETLRTHNDSIGHKRSMELLQQQEAQRMREQKEQRRQAAAGDPNAPEAKRAHRALLDDTPTSRVWQEISRTAGLTAGLSQYIALAQLVFVMVPGSVEDERRFSSMGYLQDPTRNRLDGHLALCVRMFTQDLFDLRTFPFEAALKKWLDSSRRGRYMMNR